MIKKAILWCVLLFVFVLQTASAAPSRSGATSGVTTGTVISNPWSAVGEGIEDINVDSVAMDENGTIYVADSTGSGDTYQAYIKTWNGTVWTILPYRFNEVIYKLLYDPTSSTLYVAGAFTRITNEVGVSLGEPRQIAMWHRDPGRYTGRWETMGRLNGKVLDITIGAGGLVYVGGEFTGEGEGDTRIGNVARWSGSSWTAAISSQPLIRGDGVKNLIYDPIRHLLYASTTHDSSLSGELEDAGDPYRIRDIIYFLNESTTTGSVTWEYIGIFSNRSVETLEVDGSGNLYVGGSFRDLKRTPTNTFSSWLHGLAKWNGSRWEEPFSIDIDRSGRDEVVIRSLLYNEGQLYIGGGFDSVGCRLRGSFSIKKVNNFVALDLSSGSCTRFGSQTGTPTTTTAIALYGVDGEINDMVASGGFIYVVGGFRHAGGIDATYVARVRIGE